MELVTVTSSDLFGQDDYIKKYLESPDLPFITVIKIGLRYYILGDLILQLDELKNYLESTNPHLFMYVFGKTHKPRK
jgi:hypothetical protein